MRHEGSADFAVLILSSRPLKIPVSLFR